MFRIRLSSSTIPEYSLLPEQQGARGGGRGGGYKGGARDPCWHITTMLWHINTSLLSISTPV